jgi:hypothetical protein
LINQLAGILGMNPDPFTLNDLSEMVHARNKAAWSHTAFISATIINSNPFRKNKRAVEPNELNPYAQQEQRHKKPDVYVSVKKFAKFITEKQK